MYELIQKYGKGKGEPVIWKSINILDKALKEYMPEDKYKALERCIYYQMEEGYKLIDLTINWLQDNPFGDEKVWRYFNS